MKENVKKICHDCGKEIIPDADGIGTGYGIDPEGHCVCYACCGKRDAQGLDELKVGEKYCLYLSRKDGKYCVVNWPSSLVIPVTRTSEGRHNKAGSRTDVWFRFNGKRFQGTQYGNFNEICHIRRLKDA